MCKNRGPSLANLDFDLTPTRVRLLCSCFTFHKHHSKESEAREHMQPPENPKSEQTAEAGPDRRPADEGFVLLCHHAHV